MSEQKAREAPSERRLADSLGPADENGLGHLAAPKGVEQLALGARVSEQRMSLARMRRVILIAIGVPFAIAFVATELRWAPAMILVNKIGPGEMTMKKAILCNWGALMLAELALLLPVALIVSFFRKRTP